MIESNTVFSYDYNHRLAGFARSYLDFIPLLFFLKLFIKLAQNLLLLSEFDHLKVLGHLLFFDEDLQFVIESFSLGGDFSL